MAKRDQDGAAALEGLTQRLQDPGAYRRPWQLMLVGTGEAPPQISDEARATLTRVLDLSPQIPALVLRSDHGALHVTRDYAGDTGAAVDRAITRIFDATPELTGIELPKRTATSKDPHASPSGKCAASIVAWRRSGKISPDEAITELKTLHQMPWKKPQET